MAAQSAPGQTDKGGVSSGPSYFVAVSCLGTLLCIILISGPHLVLHRDGTGFAILFSVTPSLCKRAGAGARSKIARAV